jgi:hypothetical protein
MAKLNSSRIYGTLIVDSTLNGIGLTSGTDTFTLTRGSTSLVRSGAHALTLTTTGATNITFPTSGTLMTNPMTTLGDILYGGASGVPTRLAGETTTTKKFLTSVGVSSAATAPTWSTISASDVPTLNQNTTGSAATLTTARTLTIGSTGKTFNGSADVSWSLAEIGAQAAGSYLTGIDSSMVTTALGYTPYNSTNPSGYITGITSGMVTTALGYTPYNSTNPSGYITGITSGMVTTALGYTPQDSSTAITTSNIGSQSVSYATTAGSATDSTKLPLSGGTLTGSLRVQKNGHASGADDYHLELFSPNTGSEVSLRFHQSQQWYQQIRARSDGFHFTQGNNNTYYSIYAGTGIFNNGVSLSGGNLSVPYSGSGSISNSVTFSNGSVGFGLRIATSSQLGVSGFQKVIFTTGTPTFDIYDSGNHWVNIRSRSSGSNLSSSQSGATTSNWSCTQNLAVGDVIAMEVNSENITSGYTPKIIIFTLGSNTTTPVDGKAYSVGWTLGDSTDQFSYTMSVSFSGSTIYTRLQYYVDLFTSQTISGITFGRTIAPTAFFPYVGNIWRVTKV